MNKTNKQFRKVDFAEYAGKYDTNVGKRLATSPDSVSLEELRAYIYGYTFTEGYADGRFPDEMFMDYWRDSDDAVCDLFVAPPMPPNTSKESWEPSDPDEFEIVNAILDDCEPEMDSIMDDDDYDVETLQERRILEAIDSTGDGKTPETALCVTDVGHEYEYLARVFPYFTLKVTRQTLYEDSIDRLEFDENPFGIECIYFDIRRRFEVGYPRR